MNREMKFEQYEPFLKENEQAMISALQKLIRFNTEQADPVTTKDGEVYPFGQGVQDCFEACLELARGLGFETCNVDNYGGHIDWPGSGKDILDEEGKVIGHEEPKIMAILGHLDVVPAGSGWDFEPYGGEVKDGYIYGRGTTDDKGPVVSCLYAMKSLKDAGFQPENTVRIILGLDEETAWKGMNYYFEKTPRPDYGFTPDADFPVINGEKGMLIFDLAKKFGKNQAGSKGLTLRSLSGGTAPNSVPDRCRAVVRSEVVGAYDAIKEKAAAYREETGYKLTCKGMGKSLELTAVGIASHGAKPECGLNAVSVMMEFLGRLNFVNEEINDFVGFYNRYIGFILDGAALGIDFEDEKSGKMVFNLGMAEIGPEAAKLTINVRYPVTCTEEQIFRTIEPVLTQYNLGVIKGKNHDPLYLDLDNPMVETMLEIYRKHTGDTESKPLVIGGGTYARSTPGIIAYGGQFPGDEDLMHQKNERMSLERFRQMTAIYAEAICRLSCGF
ncbi:MAG: dipeptidase PepV [Firmicutes bacterium]|nr:dipeptidase PepV [Bacillota bacterium]